MGKQSSNQTGAQDQGFANSGKAGNINTGTQINSTTQPQQSISGSANTVSYSTTQNGLNADALSQILGTVIQPTPSQVNQVTPGAMAATPPAPVTTTAANGVSSSTQKKIISYGIIAAVLVVLFLIVRKLIK